MTGLTRNHSHVLLTLGTLFAFGGASRFLPENIATAEEFPPPAAEAAETFATATDRLAPVSVEKPMHTATIRDPSNSTTTCLNADIAQSLSEDVWLFEAEKTAMRDKEISLATWEADLEAQTAELRALQNALEERWLAMQTDADEDLEHLAKMYGAMKANQAAQIFNQMDPDFAAGFLFQLPSEQAGLILASMDQEKAYIVSVSMASLNADMRSNPPQRG